MKDKKHLLKESAIEQMQTTIDGTVEREKEIADEIALIKARFTKSREEHDRNLRVNEELKVTMGADQQQMNTLRHELNENLLTRRDNKIALEQNAHLQLITDEYEKQNDFYSMLEKRIKTIQSEIEDGFGNFTQFIEPKVAAECIKKQIEGTGFDTHKIALRGLKNAYDTSLWQFCEKKINKITIQPQETRHLTDTLDDALMKNDVTPYWNKA